MKTAELREKTPEELQALLLVELRTQFNLRMSRFFGNTDKETINNN